MSQRRDRLGRINSNWRRQQNHIHAVGEHASKVAQALNPLEHVEGQVGKNQKEAE